MRRFTRVLAVAVGAAIAVTGLTAAPASALNGGGIGWDAFEGSAPSQLLIRVTAYADIDGSLSTEGFAGTVTLTSGDTSTTVPVSASGGTADAVLDVRDLAPGEATVTGSILPTGDVQPTALMAGMGTIKLIADPDLGGTVPAPYLMAARYGSLWGCDEVQYRQGYEAGCTVSAPRSGTETWQKGFKLDYDWSSRATTATTNWCELLPRLTISLPTPTGVVETRMMTIQVPTTFTRYTVPMLQADMSGLHPGYSSFPWEIACHDTATQSTSFAMSMTNAVPDLPPSAPSAVTASPADGSLSVSTGGATVYGAAPLQGYDVTVRTTDGSTVAEQQVVRSITTVGAMQRMVASGVTHTFRGLNPGTYVVTAAAFNSVGASDPVTSSVVQVTAAKTPTVKPAPKPLSAVRKAKAKRVGTRAAVSWHAPAKVGPGVRGYTLSLTRAGHVLRTVHLTASKRSVVLRKLTKHRAYRVVITVIAKDGRRVRSAVKISG